jgi:hypothetical protein
MCRTLRGGYHCVSRPTGPRSFSPRVFPWVRMALPFPSGRLCIFRPNGPTVRRHGIEIDDDTFGVRPCQRNGWPVGPEDSSGRTVTQGKEPWAWRTAGPSARSVPARGMGYGQLRHCWSSCWHAKRVPVPVLSTPVLPPLQAKPYAALAYQGSSTHVLAHVVG